jgi:hypothetical protein
MKALTCAATRRRLHAYCDNELSITDQIAVGAHLDWCDECAAAVADWRELGAVLRGSLRAPSALSADDADALCSTVINRLSEQPPSFAASVREFIEDRHLMYSGLTAALGMFACIMSLFGMIGLGAEIRPDSLAAMINSVPPPPGSNENPVPIDAFVMMPRALDQAFSTAPLMEGDDGEFMITAVVTREGTVTNLELHQGARTKAAGELLGAVSQARFEPARIDGLPVAVSMVWLVANTTVRASEPALATAPPPVARRRVA